METNQILRKQLLDLLRGGNAHMPFKTAIADFPAADFNTRSPNGDYTPWRLLEHMRITQWDILEFVRNPKYASPEWPIGYWPAIGETTDQAGWDETIHDFLDDLKSFEDIVENPGTDLTADLPHAPGYTILREALLIADHNAFHMGEFAILRQVMGTWGKGHR
jgi:hypothetical protein